MLLSGQVLRALTSFDGGRLGTHHHRPVAGVRFSGALRVAGLGDMRMRAKPKSICGFIRGGDGHYKYYPPAITCGGVVRKEMVFDEKTMNKSLKLLKGLSGFCDVAFGLDPQHGLVDQVKGKMISEAVDVLVDHLRQLKAEKKEMKRRRKEEKAKLKVSRMKNRLEKRGRNSSSSSSSSEYSDSDCDEVVNMGCRRHANSRISPPAQPETTINLQPPNQQEIQNEVAAKKCSHDSTGNCGGGCSEEALTPKIEVCMGGKCKKSGAAALLEEFRKAVGGEGSVVGCKCMGKCSSGPNVKVLNGIDGSRAVAVDDNGDDYVRTPDNPLFIGVGLEDVGAIVARCFGGNGEDLGLAESL